MKIILSTFSKNEHYIDLCMKVIDELWADHPEVIIFTDRGRFLNSNKIISTQREWVAMMSECIDQCIDLKKIDFNEQVLILLEDHIPYGNIDGKLIFELGEFLKINGNTYLNLSGHGRSEKIIDIYGCNVHNMVLHTFSSLHPSIWSVEHFKRTLDYAIKNNITDPWGFEKIRLENKKHFTTGSLIWPSTHGGFLWTGMVNVPALKYMKQGSLLPLRRKLFIKLIREAPGRIFQKYKYGFIKRNRKEII